MPKSGGISIAYEIVPDKLSRPRHRRDQKTSMEKLMDAAGERRLSEYFDRIGRVLGRKGRRESFALYAEGILGNGERKSIEPIAARGCADPSRADAEHQRFCHFVLDAPWSDHDVRLEAAR